jgi:dynactin complex subunit
MDDHYDYLSMNQLLAQLRDRDNTIERLREDLTIETQELRSSQRAMIKARKCIASMTGCANKYYTEY